MTQSLYTCALGFLLAGISGCSSLKTSSRQEAVLSPAELKPIGRFARTDGRLELISSAAHFGVSFEGAQCTLLAELQAGQDHNYLQYELDGVYQKRLRVQGERVDTLRISSSSPGRHVLRIYKTTEAQTGPIFIHQLRARGLRSLPVPEGPFIEFIGNSITCGAAADASEVACGTGIYHDQHNAYQAYGPRVARSLKANFVLSSVSGIGLYRNWNSDGPAMPQVYDRLDLREGSSRRWETSAFAPAVVSVALGTNDFSKGDGKKARAPFDPEAFTRAYVSFVKRLKTRYPKARLILLGSPMVTGGNQEVFKTCLNQVKKEIETAYPADRPVTLFFFQPMPPRGCASHPSVEDHALMADQLVPVFRKLLN